MVCSVCNGGLDLTDHVMYVHDMWSRNCLPFRSILNSLPGNKYIFVHKYSKYKFFANLSLMRKYSFKRIFCSIIQSCLFKYKDVTSL